MCRTRILLTLLSGFPTMLSQLSVISHQLVLKWRPHSLGIQHPSKRCLGG
uniref:Uncharacterized protein n=1 Tax=Rhizophora mucronata TaxID=61149 RepID=A0A2P2QIA4_RHIMU